MGLFKKLFGASENASADKIKEEIEQVKSEGEPKIYPILKPGDWVGIQAGALKQTIFGTQENPELVIAYGYDTPENFVFLMPRDLEGKDPSEILRSANENLENFEQGFDMTDDEHGKVLYASGQDYSSEKVLSKSHMMKAHELLGAKELLVSIPRRTCMYIIARDADQAHLDTFIKVHKHTWQDDSYGNAPIIDAFLTVIDGEIDGMIPLSQE